MSTQHQPVPRSGSALCAPLAALFFLGCSGGDGPELAQVSGTVTLDGQPLSAAHVEFTPEHGRPSQAVTDAQGNYELMYTPETPGAVLGKHSVRITTATSNPGDEGDLKAQAPVEKVPAAYNSRTELTEEVQAGDNTIDFAVDSKRVAPPSSATRGGKGG